MKLSPAIHRFHRFFNKLIQAKNVSHDKLLRKSVCASLECVKSKTYSAQKKFDTTLTQRQNHTFFQAQHLKNCSSMDNYVFLKKTKKDNPIKHESVNMYNSLIPTYCFNIFLKSKYNLLVENQHIVLPCNSVAF